MADEKLLHARLLCYLRVINQIENYYHYMKLSNLPLERQT